VLLGDAIAARHRPDDACLGNGPQLLLQPGETLVDVRPGLLSKSMQVWVVAFTGPKSCRWSKSVAGDSCWPLGALYRQPEGGHH